MTAKSSKASRHGRDEDIFSGAVAITHDTNGNGHRRHRNRRALSTSEHVVHFYERDEFLVDSVATFIATGLDAGAACVVIATPAHRRQLAAHLAAGGRDVAEATARGSFVALDAAETLARFMSDGMPDAKRFREVIGSVIAGATEAAGSSERVRVFGEMVALLWKDGNPTAAIRLEELWNDLAAGSAHPFALFCAYPIHSFAGEGYAEKFAEICACHSRVVPDESYAALADSDERLRAVTLLQQKAASLEAEIAKRDRAEAALREREEQLAAVFHSAAVGVALLTPDARFIQVNDAFCHLVGYSQDELLAGMDCATLTHPDDCPAMFEQLDALLAGRIPTFVIEKRYRRKDGAQIWVRNSVSLARDEAGQPRHLVALCEDVTERRRADEAAAHLAAIVTSAEDAIASKTLQGIVTSWNASAERMFGYSAGEMIGQPILRLFPPDRLDEEDVILARIRAGDRIEHFETVRLTKDGRPIDVSLTISPIRDSAGTIIGASKIVRDITERKRAEEALRQSGERLRFIAETMPQKIFTATPNGDVDYFNPQWMEFTGLAMEEIRDWGWKQLVHPDDLDETLARWRHSIASGEPFSGEHRFHRADGVDRWHVSRAIPIRDDAGRITMWIGSATDIDEQKQLEERQNAFISMASHELKTPVTSLTGFTQILRRRLDGRPDADPQTLRFLERMDAQLKKLASLIGDLLDVSRMQTGALAYRKAAFDLDEMVRETVENVQAASTTHNLRLVGATHAQIDGDQDRLGQVLVNLLTNAIKYSPLADTVVVRLDADRERAHVAVQDFGIGIARDDHERIFQRFYQVGDREHNTFPGLGIGLYIAWTIVEQHGGRLWLESQPGAGSTFHVSLPLAQPAPADAKTRPTTPATEVR